MIKSSLSSKRWQLCGLLYPFLLKKQGTIATCTITFDKSIPWWSGSVPMVSNFSDWALLWCCWSSQVPSAHKEAILFYQNFASFQQSLLMWDTKKAGVKLSWIIHFVGYYSSYVSYLICRDLRRFAIYLLGCLAPYALNIDATHAFSLVFGKIGACSILRIAEWESSEYWCLSSYLTMVNWWQLQPLQVRCPYWKRIDHPSYLWRL